MRGDCEPDAKVLLTTFGTRGDVQPFYALARGLSHAQYEVVMRAPPDYRAWAGAEQIAFLPADDNYGALMAERQARPARAAAVMARQVPEQFRRWPISTTMVSWCNV